MDQYVWSPTYWLYSCSISKNFICNSCCPCMLLFSETNHRIMLGVSRNLPEQIMRFFKDQYLQHEVTGKSTHSLQSYNNSAMPEIKVCFIPAAVHKYYELEIWINWSSDQNNWSPNHRTPSCDSAKILNDQGLCCRHVGLCMCLWRWVFYFPLSQLYNRWSRVIKSESEKMITSEYMSEEER